MAEERIFMKGGEALAEAAVRVGVRFFAGYPITPQNEVPEYFSWRLPEVGGTFVQAESELASTHMIAGAACTGTRAMTSSSSCGVALMAEGTSCMAGGRVPAVIMSVQRGGPGVGAIQPAQQDYWLATKAMGNGGNLHLVYTPGTLQEAIDMMDFCFAKAEEYRNPVILLLDGTICSMMEPVVLPEMKEPKLAGDDWRLEGTGLAREHRTISCGAMGEFANIAAAKMYKEWEKTEVKYEEIDTEDAEIILTGYGICSRIELGLLETLRAEGVKVGVIRPICVNPFPKEAFEKLDPAKVKMVINVEMAIPGQYGDDVQRYLSKDIKFREHTRASGNVPSDKEVLNAIHKFLEEVDK